MDFVRSNFLQNPHFKCRCTNRRIILLAWKEHLLNWRRWTEWWFTIYQIEKIYQIHKRKHNVLLKKMPCCRETTVKMKSFSKIVKRWEKVKCQNSKMKWKSMQDREMNWTKNSSNYAEKKIIMESGAEPRIMPLYVHIVLASPSWNIDSPWNEKTELTLRIQKIS